jgi:hypothetical protein
MGTSLLEKTASLVRVPGLSTLKMVAVDCCKSGYQSAFFTDFISRLSLYTHLFKLVSGRILSLNMLSTTSHSSYTRDGAFLVYGGNFSLNELLSEGF